MASPLCTVNSLSTVDGVDVAASSTITIALDDVSGVTVWDLQVIYTDELQIAATLTAALSINQIAKTATLVMPSSACSLVFQSQINNGRDSAGRLDASLTTTFAVNVPLASGRRLIAFNETLENSQSFGWIETMDGHLRAMDPVILTVSAADTEATADTLALRDSSADLKARHFVGSQLLSPTGGGTPLVLGAESGQYISAYEGLTEVARIQDLSNVSTLNFQGSSGGNLAANIANTSLYLSAGSGASGKIIQRNGTTSILETAYSGTTTYLDGQGASGTMVRSATGPLTLSGPAASYVSICEGTTTECFRIDDQTAVSVLSGKGATATQIEATTGELRLAAASGSNVVLKEGSTTVLNVFDNAGVATLSGGGTGLVINSGIAGGVTITAASGSSVIIKEGTTSVLNLNDISNVSTIAGQGSSGTMLTSATGNVTINAPSGSQVNITENNTNILAIKDSGSYSEVNFPTGVGVISSQVVSIAGSTYVSVQSPLGRTAAIFDTTNSVIYSGASADTTTATGYVGHLWNGTGGSRKYDHRYSRIQTTDGTVNVVAWTSPTLSNGVMHHVEAVVVANTNGTSGATYRVSGSYRTSGGTTTIIGAVTAAHTGEDVAGWNATLGVSGATVRVLVTGAAATNINWECYVTVYYGASYA